MKKITFLFTLAFFTVGATFCQDTFTTGEIILTPGQTAQIDITASGVTLTMTGQDDRWLGLGFDAQSMTNGKDVVIFDGTNLTDRTFIGVGSIPTSDGPANQNWNIESNTTNAGTRTIVATRSLAGDGVNDHVFTAAAGSIDLVYSNGNGPTFILDYHGGGTTNRGIVPGNSITLGVLDFADIPKFKISPNPSFDYLNIELPPSVRDANLQVFDLLGKMIANKAISNVNASLDVSNWNKGIYIVHITSGTLSQAKRFVKQ